MRKVLIYRLGRIKKHIKIFGILLVFFIIYSILSGKSKYLLMSSSACCICMWFISFPDSLCKSAKHAELLSKSNFCISYILILGCAIAASALIYFFSALGLYRDAQNIFGKIFVYCMCFPLLFVSFASPLLQKHADKKNSYTGLVIMISSAAIVIADSYYNFADTASVILFVLFGVALSILSYLAQKNLRISADDKYF